MASNNKVDYPTLNAVLISEIKRSEEYAQDAPAKPLSIAAQQALLTLMADYSKFRHEMNEAVAKRQEKQRRREANKKKQGAKPAPKKAAAAAAAAAAEESDDGEEDTSDEETAGTQ